MRTMILAVALFWTAAALAEDKAISFPPGSDAAITLTVPKTAKVTTDKGKMSVDASKCNIYLWMAPKGKTVDEVVAGIGNIVKSEVYDIKVDETKSIKVADADAKDIMAKSKETDDNDPGSTNIIVFTVGGKVIVACCHGENDAAARQHQPMLDILNTAKAP